MERSAWIRSAVRRFRRWWGRRPPGVRLALHIAGMLVLAVGVAALLWWWMGMPRVSSPYSRKEALEATKLVLAMVGGLGGVVFLTVAYRRQRTDEAAHQREEVASRREDTKLFNERFGAATEQLSSPEPANQLGGIYALAGLADDWEAASLAVSTRTFSVTTSASRMYPSVRHRIRAGPSWRRTLIARRAQKLDVPVQRGQAPYPRTERL